MICFGINECLFESRKWVTKKLHVDLDSLIYYCSSHRCCLRSLCSRSKVLVELSRRLPGVLEQTRELSSLYYQFLEPFVRWLSTGCLLRVIIDGCHVAILILCESNNTNSLFEDTVLGGSTFNVKYINDYIHKNIYIFLKKKLLF